jgi:predicted anti-sigma-YlaC factor YlaD
VLSCREITSKAGELLDGELGFRERMAVRMHLAICVHCRRFSRQLRTLVEALRRRADREQLPSGFVDQVMSAINSARDNQEEPRGL